MISFENTNNDREIIIHKNEYSISFARSGGPGGQNVNKLNTKAVLKFNINESTSLNEREKQKLKQFWKNRINENSELVLFAEGERTQAQNKAVVIIKLNDFIRQALVEEKKRIGTKPTRSSNEKRIKNKKQNAKKKESRKKVDY